MVQENTFRLVEVGFFRLSRCSCWDISEALLHIKKVFSQISYIKRENIGKRKSISIEISFFVHQVDFLGNFRCFTYSYTERVFSRISHI